MRNWYAIRARICARQFRRIVRLFALDMDATQTAALSGLNRNTVNRYLRGICEHITQYCKSRSPFSGEIEEDESYFSARRMRCKRGRGAFGKTAVFGVFIRNGCVYTGIIPDCRKSALQGNISGRVTLDRVIHSAGWRGYNGLVDVDYARHRRVNHSEEEFVRGKTHINGIRDLAKSRLNRFRGMNKHTFYLHLKKCEFRFNHCKQDMYRLILKLCRNKPLNLSWPLH